MDEETTNIGARECSSPLVLLYSKYIEKGDLNSLNLHPYRELNIEFFKYLRIKNLGGEFSSLSR